MQSDKEIRQALIAMVTATYESWPEDGSAGVQDVSLLDALPRLFDYELEFDVAHDPSAPADVIEATYAAAVDRAVKNALHEQIGTQVGLALAELAVLFCQLAREFETACPDVDVRGFLRRTGLAVADEDDE